MEERITQLEKKVILAIHKAKTVQRESKGLLSIIVGFPVLTLIIVIAVLIKYFYY